MFGWSAMPLWQFILRLLGLSRGWCWHPKNSLHVKNSIFVYPSLQKRNIDAVICHKSDSMSEGNYRHLLINLKKSQKRKWCWIFDFFFFFSKSVLFIRIIGKLRDYRQKYWKLKIKCHHWKTLVIYSSPIRWKCK